MASPPFSISELIPGDSDIISQFPASERQFRDIVESWLSMEHDATTGRHKLPVNTTAALGALSFAVGSFRFDTDLDVMQFQKSSGVWDAISVPSGFRAMAQQTNAPPGWTKETDAAFNDATFKIFTGSVANGGTAAFSSVFAARTILQANLPNVNFAVTATGTAASDGAHTHSIGSDGEHVHTAGGASAFWASTAAFTDNLDAISGDGNEALVTMDNAGDHDHGGATGSNGAHTHSVSVTGNAASGGSGTALDFDVKFIGAVVIVKD